MMIKRRNGLVCRSQSGFTLVELMITMVIFVLAITAASQIFVGLLTQFKQQSKVAETNIEGVIGLELLRADIEQAGFGLPWNLNGVTYCEAAHDLSTPLWDDTVNNDTADNPPNCNPSNPPRAFVIDTGHGTNGSDILVIKATNVATNDASHKWTYITDNNGAFTIQKWNSKQEDLGNTDYVIALMPSASAGRKKVLVNGGVQFTGPVANPGQTAGLQPTANTLLSNLVYGIKPDDTAHTAVRMPFNRADYYIRTPAAGSMPTRCAPGTGVLYKATVNHTDGMHTEMPILDCVADMQVVVSADTAATRTGTPNAFWISGAGVGSPLTATSLTAAQTIRDQVLDVRVYIVAHEGQFDASYSYKNQVRTPAANCDFDKVVCIKDMEYGTPTLVKAVDLSALTGIGTQWSGYRWKLYTLVVTPYNLR